ncbi:CHASE3 domain-containing protein [Candidatus Halobeggiatoa sp. HSG11]|nr:CHASE3 domain-containing protein [Candidatus Halobeggiatoa sp. HSG11]
MVDHDQPMLTNAHLLVVLQYVVLNLIRHLKLNMFFGVITTFWRTTKKLVVDMETGERGFLITGKDNFLEPYHR